MNAREVLVEAKKLFGENGEGWTTGTYHRWSPLRNRDVYCAVGAVDKIAYARVAQTSMSFCPARDEALLFLSQAILGGIYSVISFNDMQRNFTVISKWFDRAIKLAEEKYPSPTIPMPSQKSPLRRQAEMVLAAAFPFK